jgi:hypothetical protein
VAISDVGGSRGNDKLTSNLCGDNSDINYSSVGDNSSDNSSVGDDSDRRELGSLTLRLDLGRSD